MCWKGVRADEWMRASERMRMRSVRSDDRRLQFERRSAAKLSSAQLRTAAVVQLHTHRRRIEVRGEG